MNVWQTVTNVILTSYKLTPSGSILPANSFARDSCNLNPDARNRTRLFALLLTTFLLAVGVGSVSATTYYSKASANWAANTTWSTVSYTSSTNTGTYPQAGDIANIGNGNTVTIAANAACTTLNIVNASTLTVGAYSLTVSGTTTVGGALNITSATGTQTFTGAVTINAGGAITESTAATLAFGNNVTIGGTLTENGVATVSIAGSLTNNGTYTASTGMHTFSGTTQTIGGTSTNTIPSAAFTGTYTNNGTLTVATALSGTGGLTQAANATLNIGGTSGITTLTATASGNTVSYTGAGQTINSTNYYNLTLSGSGTDGLQTGTTSISGNLTLSGTVSTTPAVGLTIGGNLSIGNGTTFTTGNYALTVTGTTTIGAGTTGNLTISSANGATLFTGLVTVAAGATWNNSGGAAVEFRGGITNSGTFTAGYGVYTFDTNNQALTGTFTIPNVTITGITLTNNNSLTVSTALSGSGGLTQAANATLNIGGTSGITTLTATANGNTVNYTGTAQTINTANYYNLALAGSSGTKTFVGTTNTSNAFTINSGVVANLGTGLTQTAGTLSLGGAGEPAGSWGGTGSAATFINTTYFSATTGILNVSSASCTAGSWTGLISTDWNNANNWCSGSVPTASTNVIINSGGNQPVIGSAGGLCNNITINSGATLTITGSNALTVSGNWTNNGTFTYNTSTVTMNGTSQTISGSSTSFYNLTLSGSGTVTYTATATSTTNVLTVNSTETLQLNGTTSLTPVSAAVNGTVIVQNTASLVKGTGTISFTSGSTYNHAINGGTIPTATWNSASTCTVTGMIATSPGGLAQTFGNLIWNCTGQTGSVTTTGNIVVNGNFTLTAGTFALNNATSNTLTIAGNYTQTGGTFDFNRGTSGSSNAYLSGNFSNTAGAGSITTSGSGAPNGFFIFTGSSLQTLNMPTSGAAIWVMYTINSGSNVQLLSNFTLYGANSATFYGQITVNGTLNVGTYTILDGSGVTGGTVFTLNSGGTLITANTAGINGSIPSTYTTTTFSTGANYTYNGAAAQVTGTLLTGANNLTINNSAGVTLSTATTVSGILTLTSGTLTTTSTNLLSVTNTATTAITGGSATSFINGPVKWTLPARLASGSTYNYPMGSGTTYLPFSLVNPTSGTGTVTAQVQAFATGSGGTADGTTVSSLSTSEYWSLTTAGNFTSSSVSISRQTAIAPYDVIGGSATLAGTYTSLGGTAGTYGITGSTAIGSDRYFVLASNGPVITVTPTTATFTGEVSVNSASQTFTVIGKLLSTNTITVTAPSNYQLSTNGTTWGSNGGTVTYTPTSGSVNGTLYVRYSPLAVESSVSVTVNLTSIGATSRTITVTGTAYGTAVYVRVTAYGNEDGTSWSNAATTVQKGVETSNGLTNKLPVYVAAGDYYTDPNYTTGDYAVYTSTTGANWQSWANTFVMRSGVNVYGAFPEFGTTNNNNADTTMRVRLNKNALYKTTLHGGTNYRVLGPPYAQTPLNAGAYLAASTTWDGFDLTGAEMTSTPSGSPDNVCGGGAFTVQNSTISNCFFEYNYGTGGSNDGAAAMMYGGTIRNCIIHDNIAGIPPNQSGCTGAIAIANGGCNVINCLIYNNFSGNGGGGIEQYSNTLSGATYSTAACYVINNTVTYNTSGTNATGIEIFSASPAVYFYNNAVWSNTFAQAAGTIHESYNAWPSTFTGISGTSLVLSTTNNSGTNPPWFVQADTTVTADYRLQSTSSALYNKGGTNTQTGTTLVPTTDIRGVFRNTPPEIGCYELASRLYYVNNAKGTDASGYGGNWSMPYATLHYALDQYSQYDFPQVRVAQGSGAYYATEDSTGVTTSGSTTTFALKKNLSIYGGFSGIRGTEPTSFAGITTTLNARNMKNYPTVLSGNAISTSVVKSSSTYSSVGTTPAILDGFTITGAASGGYAVSTPADTVKIQNCKIINNGGGGLHLNNLNKITNVVVANNSGIGISLAGTANVVNATIANNTSYGITSSSTTATVTNSILWGNNSNGDNVNISGSTPTITYTASGAASAYTNSTNGTIANNSWSANPGNIELYHRSPNFKKAANYELLLISPCLGKGLASANTLPTDANGKARLYSGTIDMGAYQKWDGMTVTSGTPATLTNVRAGYSIPLSSLTLMNDTMEVLVNPGVTFGMGGNTGLQTYWLELKQDTINNNPILSTGKIMADSVLYVRRFSKSLGGLGVWSFFGLPYTSANLGKLDGAIAENSVRIDKYIENTRATNGANKSAWTHMESSSDVKDSLLTGQGYALSFNEKVPQSDIGQTVIFPSPASVTFDNSATTPAGTDVLLETNSITSGDLWYNCGWNLVANPLTQTSTFVNAAGNWPQTSGTYSSYYGTVYLYQSATDSYTVYPLSTFNSSGLSAFGACFLQTDYAGSPAVFNASSSLTSPLRSQSLVAATSANGVPAPTLFHFNVAGSNQKSDAYVMFYDSAHADARPMEDAPIMEGVSGKAALTMNTTATGSNLALAINRLPFVGTEMEIPLQVTVPAAGTYTITMPESDGSTAVYILDTNNGYYDLKNEYSVTAKEAGTLNYILVFGQINRVQTDSNVGITLIQDQTNVTINTTGSAILQHIYVYSETGQLMNALDNLGNEVQFNLPSATSVYLVKITTSLGSITKKLINR